MVKVVKIHLSKKEQQSLEELFDIGFMRQAEFTYNNNFMKKLVASGIIIVEDIPDKELIQFEEERKSKKKVEASVQYTDAPTSESHPQDQSVPQTPT